VKAIQTANSSTVRQINRSIILNCIRQKQPISRADLARLTGIHRSNISQIAEELLRQELIAEKRGISTGRGRTPTLLFLRDTSFPVAGVSVRNCQTTIALSGLGGKIWKTKSFRTPRDPSGLVAGLLRHLGNIQGEPSPRRIGVSIPGVVNHREGRILLCPALPSYSGFPMAAELGRRAKIPVDVDNDCNLAALAELWSGGRKASELENFVLLNVGDVGVGSGIIIDGKLYRGYDSAGVGEFGHMVIDPSGPRCRCGQRGCWELYVSDRATWSRYNPGKQWSANRFQQFLQAVRRRDRPAVEALRETGTYLSIGISNIVSTLNPESIILAGEIVQVWDIISETILSNVRSPILQHHVRPATLNAEGLFLQGAIALALNSVFSDGSWRPPEA